MIKENSKKVVRRYSIPTETILGIINELNTDEVISDIRLGNIHTLGEKYPANIIVETEEKI